LKSFNKAVACGAVLEDLEVALALEDEAVGAVVTAEAIIPVGEAANGEVSSGEAVIEEVLEVHEAAVMVVGEQVHEEAVLAEEGAENEVGVDLETGVVTAPIEEHTLGAAMEEHLGEEATEAAEGQQVEHTAQAEAE